MLVERILVDLKSNIELLHNVDDISWSLFKDDLRVRRFVERSLHVMIEAVIDVGQHIISDEKLREPESYRDVFTILAENKIIKTEDLPIYMKMASFRNLIVHYYERIDDEVVYGIFQKHLGDFDLFVSEIIEFLKKKFR